MPLDETWKAHDRSWRRGALAAAVGLAAVAAVELVLSLLVSQAKVGVLSSLRFAALDVTLVALVALVVVPLAGLIFALVRRGERRAAAAAAVAGEERPSRVPLVWALAVGAAAYIGASFALTMAFRRFREPVLAALGLAGLQLLLFGAVAVLVILLAAGLKRLSARLAPRLGKLDPFGRPLPALTVLAVLVVGGAAVAVWRMPMLRAVIPVRQLLSVAIFAAGFALGLRLKRLWPALPRRRKLAIAATVAGFVVLVPLTLWKIGADDETRYLALTASPTLSHVVDAVRRLNDFDGDGYGSLLGENDCGPFDPKINPSARDIPDNGIDENCNGYDFTSKGLTVQRGERMAVPEQYRRKWNILFITIDALRYDRTGLGGNAARKRDLTPHIDALSKRGVWFNFANAPSAGTMAAVPSLLTSKFFHSGVAQRTPPGFVAPILLPENLTISDVVKKVGYMTAAILTHDYFGPKGMQLAADFDFFDNSLGEKREPKKITSQDVTDKAQAWLAARPADQSWFLWLHYLDPHGYYMAHPGDVEFGTTEEDRYDGEVAYTDKHVGRLLDFLSRSTQGKRTVIIITADHGEGFNEHGYINHGMTLYKELLHVPLMIYVPDVEPHTVDGPVSTLDILPTIADLVGVDLTGEPIEGESLVPQLFYARDSKRRVVFAETNYPEPMRTAVANDYKIIFNLKANVYQLFDLQKDPWEKVNLWGRDLAAGARMKRTLDEWLDRVIFNHDASNEAQDLRAKIILDKPPAPQTPIQASFGTIETLGWDASAKELKPGQPLEVLVYLKATATPPGNFRFEVEAQSQTAPPIRSEVIPADGLYPTSRWQPGQPIKLTFGFKLPPAWQPGPVTLKLRVLDEKRAPLPATGPAAVENVRALLGALPLVLPATPSATQPAK